MTQDKRFSEQESLRIIQQMIETAKHEQRDNGKGWIVWGWLLFSVSVLTVINLRLLWFDKFLFWNIFGILTIVFGLYEVVSSFFIKKQRKVRTYTREIFDKLNTGFFISLMFIIVGINISIGAQHGFPLLMNLYGFWILIYGAILNFKPSLIGAYVTWGLAFAAFFVNSFHHVMLLHAAAVLVGYIIPGHIAHKRFKKVNKESSINAAASV